MSNNEHVSDEAMALWREHHAEPEKKERKPRRSRTTEYQEFEVNFGAQNFELAIQVLLHHRFNKHLGPLSPQLQARAEMALRETERTARNARPRRQVDDIAEPDFLTEQALMKETTPSAVGKHPEKTSKLSPLAKRVAVIGGVTLTSLLAMGSTTQEVTATDVNKELQNNEHHRIVLNNKSITDSEIDGEMEAIFQDITALMLMEGLVAVEPVDTTGTVISPTMNVRDLPSASGEASVVGQLNKDAQVHVLAKFIDGNNTWLYVDKGDGTFQWAALRYGGTDYIAVDPTALEKLPDLNRPWEVLQADGTTIARGSISLLDKGAEQRVYALLQDATQFLPHEVIDNLQVMSGENGQMWAELAQDVQVTETVNGQETLVTHQAGDVITTQEVDGQLRLTNYLPVGQIHEVLGLSGNVRETRLLQVAADFLVVTSGQQKYGLDLLKFQQMMSNTDVQQQEQAIRQSSMIIVDQVPMDQLVRASLVRDASQQPTAIETPEAVFQLVSNPEQILEATPPAPRPEPNPMFGQELKNIGVYQLGPCKIESMREQNIQIGDLTTVLIADCSYVDGNGNNRIIGVPLAVKNVSQQTALIYGFISQPDNNFMTGYYAENILKQGKNVAVGTSMYIYFGLPNNANAGLLEQSYVAETVNNTYDQAEINAFRQSGDPAELGSNGLILPISISFSTGNA